MEIEDAIAGLGMKLDQWFDGSAAIFASKDHTSQRKQIRSRSTRLSKNSMSSKQRDLKQLRHCWSAKYQIPLNERSALLIRSL